MGRFSSAVEDSRKEIFEDIESNIRAALEDRKHSFQFIVHNLRDASYVEAACDEFDADLREDGLGLKLASPVGYQQIKEGKSHIPEYGLYFTITIVPSSEVSPRRSSSSTGPSTGSSSDGSRSGGSSGSSGGWQ